MSYPPRMTSLKPVSNVTCSQNLSAVQYRIVAINIPFKIKIELSRFNDS
jgi:hypothetical protein